MKYLLEATQEAFELIVLFDEETYRIILLSLFVSLSASIIGVLIGVMLSTILSLHQFKGKKLLLKIIHTMMGFPPVVMGLVVFLLLSRRGPFGEFEVLFTPLAMIIAQTFLVIPIVIGVSYDNMKPFKKDLINAVSSLGGKWFHKAKYLIIESKTLIQIAFVTAFGRAISEVGAVMIVGGNIQGKTRVMTSHIVLQTSMGEYSSAVAMGIVLIVLAFVIHTLLEYLMGGDEYEDNH